MSDFKSDEERRYFDQICFMAQKGIKGGAQEMAFLSCLSRLRGLDQKETTQALAKLLLYEKAMVRASAELRHTYGHGTIDRNLVARAIETLETAVSGIKDE